jgi:hypothetical protein
VPGMACHLPNLLGVFPGEQRSRKAKQFANEQKARAFVNSYLTAREAVQGDHTYSCFAGDARDLNAAASAAYGCWRDLRFVFFAGAWTLFSSGCVLRTACANIARSWSLVCGGWRV